MSCSQRPSRGLLCVLCFYETVGCSDLSRLGSVQPPRLGRKEPNMLIIGCDYHPGMQQIAWFDEESGECGEQRLEHSTGEGESYYRELKRRGVQVRMGIEASGHTRWFERLLAELEIELWIGNPARSRRNG